jgi:hypothetical protein
MTATHDHPFLVASGRNKRKKGRKKERLKGRKKERENEKEKSVLV